MQITGTQVISGVTYYSFTSVYNYGTASGGYGDATTWPIRVLAPTSPAAGVPKRFLYLLPVEDFNDSPLTYGDGLALCQSLNFHNQYNCTLIAPGFTTSNLVYADSDQNLARRHESFMLELASWVKANLAVTGGEHHWLLGFSRSGYGTACLFFRNPTVWHAAGCWDFPANWPYSDWSWADSPWGSETNWMNNCDLSQSFISQYASPWLLKTRIWIAGGPGFGPMGTAYAGAVETFAGWLATAGIPYVDNTTQTENMLHQWDGGDPTGGGWVALALAAMNKFDSNPRRRITIEAEAAPDAPGESGSGGRLRDVAWAAPLAGFHWIARRRERLARERRRGVTP
jgi:hypothetical protein